MLSAAWRTSLGISRRGALTVSWDVDPACVERNYRMVREQGETRLLPLVLDLTNPSSALGWAHEERASLSQRGPADLVMALGLFTCLLQSYIFVMLSMVYIAGAVAHEH